MVRKKRPSQAPGTAPSNSSGAPMVPNGLPHGGRQAIEGQIQGARPATADGAATAAGAAMGGGPIPKGGLMATPSTRTSEPTTAGAAMGAGPSPSAGGDSRLRMEAILTEAFKQTQSPHIFNMLQRLRGQ